MCTPLSSRNQGILRTNGRNWAYTRVSFVSFDSCVSCVRQCFSILATTRRALPPKSSSGKLIFKFQCPIHPSPLSAASQWPKHGGLFRLRLWFRPPPFFFVFDDSFAPVAQIKCSFSLSFLPITTGGGRMDDGPRGDGRERERESVAQAT
jgi:hypothetical protein